MKNRLYVYGIFIAITSPTSAFAYIDSGTSLLLMQGILALLGAVVVFVKNPLQTIKSLISRLKKKDRA